MIGYLTGSELLDLIRIGAVHCLYSTSQTYEYLGDITTVHFFNSAWYEVAHQTMLDSQNTFIKYSRSWGAGFNGVRDGYTSSHKFTMLMEMASNSDIIDLSVYRVV